MHHPDPGHEAVEGRYVRLSDGDPEDESDGGREGVGDTASPHHENEIHLLSHDSLGFSGGVALVCCDIIGSGIFASPGIVLHWSGSVGASLALWCTAGIITFVGFSCLAELSVNDPHAGGLFYYYRTTFGGSVAFSWTFINFTIIVPGSLAALAITFAHYLASALPDWQAGGFEEDADWRLKAVACAALLLVVCLNCMSAAQGGSVAKGFLTATLSGCLFVILLGVIFACGGGGGAGEGEGGGPAAVDAFTNQRNHLSVPAENFSPSSLFKGTKGPASLGVALISALWAFSGAMDIASAAEELRDAERMLPKVGSTGLAIVSTVYVLMNIAYLLVLPAEVISHAGSENGTEAIGVVFAKTVAGRWAGLAVTLVVTLSSLGALNSCLYLSARQFYATARDGLFPAVLARTNAKAAPHCAILATGAWTVALLAALSSFATLVNYLSAAMWLFYGLVGVAVIVSRWREQASTRLYTVPGYPVVPVIYVIVCTCLSGCTLVADPIPCLAALLFVASAFPIHWVWFVWLPRRRARLRPGGQSVGVRGEHRPPSQYGPVS